MSATIFEFDDGAPRRVIRPLTVPLDGVSGLEKGFNRRQVVVVVVEQTLRPIQLDRLIDRHTYPLSRYRAQRAKPDNEDGKRQTLNHSTHPPCGAHTTPLHRQPTSQPPIVAYLRLVRTIRIRTMIVIIILAIHNHDNPF